MDERRNPDTEGQNWGRRASDDPAKDFETRISVLETKTDFTNNTLISIDYTQKQVAANLNEHIKKEDTAFDRINSSINQLETRVGAHSYNNAELVTTMNINNQLITEHKAKLEELHTISDANAKEILQAKTMFFTISKISGIIAIIVGAVGSALYKIWENYK